jgi:HlyD family secretion protein
MRILIRLLIVLGVLGGIAALGAWGQKYWKERNRPQFRIATVTSGPIILAVNSTGEVKPVIQISVGSVVSGPIKSLHVDFNDHVSEGQLLAEIDPRLFAATVAGDRAMLANRLGEIDRVQADLAGARAAEARVEKLLQKGAGYISDVEVDQAKFTRQALEAQLAIAKAGLEQAQASLENSEANLAYTRIVSPVEGIIIDRKIEPGQTLAAAFQTPELFIVAPDIRKEMHIFASIDEADIGLIRQAADDQQPVEFSVDAYPDLLFTASIKQIRLSPVTNQNVVTYPVIVSTSNEDMKLMPGMTASLSFQIERRETCVRIPNAALRYFPEVQHVRESDRYLVTGLIESQSADEEKEESASEKSTAASKRDERYVWVWEDPWLRAVPVTIGIRDSTWTELIKGEIKVDDVLVVANKK